MPIHLYQEIENWICITDVNVNDLNFVGTPEKLTIIEKYFKK